MRLVVEVRPSYGPDGERFDGFVEVSAHGGTRRATITAAPAASVLGAVEQVMAQAKPLLSREELVGLLALQSVTLDEDDDEDADGAPAP